MHGETLVLRRGKQPTAELIQRIDRLVGELKAEGHAIEGQRTEELAEGLMSWIWAGQAVHVQLYENKPHDTQFVEALSSDESTAFLLRTVLTAVLPIASVEELLAVARDLGGTDPSRLYRLALASDIECDKRVFEVIATHLTHDDPNVAAGALMAVAELRWPEFLSLLPPLLQRDGVVGHAARLALSAFDDGLDDDIVDDDRPVEALFLIADEEPARLGQRISTVLGIMGFEPTPPHEGPDRFVWAWLHEAAMVSLEHYKDYRANSLSIVANHEAAAEQILDALLAVAEPQPFEPLLQAALRPEREPRDLIRLALSGPPEDQPETTKLLVEGLDHDDSEMQMAALRGCIALAWDPMLDALEARAEQDSPLGEAIRVAMFAEFQDDDTEH